MESAHLTTFKSCSIFERSWTLNRVAESLAGPGLKPAKEESKNQSLPGICYQQWMLQYQGNWAFSCKDHGISSYYPLLGFVCSDNLPGKCPVNSLGQSVNKCHDETLNVMSNLQVHQSAIVCLSMWTTVLSLAILVSGKLRCFLAGFSKAYFSWWVSLKLDQATGILSHFDVIYVTKVEFTDVIDKPQNLCST